MSPHKPKKLDEINESFLNSKQENTVKEEPAEKEAVKEKQKEKPKGKQNVFSPLKKDEVKEKGEEYTLDEVQDLIEGIEDKGENPVFHDLDSDTEKTDVTEKEIYEAFPDVDPYALVIDKNSIERAIFEDDDDERARLQSARDDAKELIKNEKIKIKDQKKLEKKIQKPFKAKRKLTVLFILLLIAGLAVSSFGFFAVRSGSGQDEIVPIFNSYILCYCDNDSLKYEALSQRYLLFTQNAKAFQGNNTVLFASSGGTVQIGTVNGHGDGIYYLNTDTSLAITDKDGILGKLVFSVPCPLPVQKFMSGNPFVFYISALLYFGILILLYALIIKKKNRIIEEYREEYDIVK